LLEPFGVTLEGRQPFRLSPAESGSDRARLAPDWHPGTAATPDRLLCMGDCVPLFPETIRDNQQTIRASESHYGFLQRVDDSAFEQIRMLLNNWFARFAAMQESAATADLRGRFEAKQGGQFEAAFWELYLHEALARLGFEIGVHPESERGTRPDFDVCGRGSHFYLEAVTPSPGAFSDDGPGSVKTVIEYVNEAFDPRWRLSLKYVHAGTQTPRKTTVRRAVSEWLATLDWETSWRGSLADSEHPRKEIRVGDWTVALTALPWPPENQNPDPKPMIIMGPGKSGSPERLGPAILPILTEKANKYGDLDAPLVVAAWVLNTFADEETMPLALFGRGFDGRKPGVHPAGLPPGGENRESLWAPRARNRGRASAVLAAERFGFGYPAITRAFPHLWINPWADRPLDAELPFPASVVSQDQTTTENRPPQISPSDFFGSPRLPVVRFSES